MADRVSPALQQRWRPPKIDSDGERRSTRDARVQTVNETLEGAAVVQVVTKLEQVDVIQAVSEGVVLEKPRCTCNRVDITCWR